MSWDPVWEEIFRERSSWGKYPPEELVRFVASNYYSVEDRKSIRILELGCGPGGGPGWFVMREGFSYAAIDGSDTAVSKALDRFKEEALDGDLRVGQFDDLPWDSDYFDCVIDVASLQCNSEQDTKAILAEVLRVLAPGGRHFSLTSKSESWGDKTGTQVDPTSFKDVSEGPYVGMGLIRFATKESIAELYGNFKDINIEYSIRSAENCAKEIGHWVINCEK